MTQTKERLALLSEVAGRLLLSDSPQSLVEELCTKVMSFLGCHAFFNFLTDEDKKRLHLNACSGISEDAARRIEWLNMGDAVCGCVAQQGVRFVAENIQEVSDPRMDLVKSYGIQAYACHPLLTTGGKVIGTVSFGSKTKTRFSDDDLSLMKTVTDHVAIAMERIRSLESERRQRRMTEELAATLEQRVAERTVQVQQLANRLRALSVELSQAEQLERRRVTTILHDHIQQVLVASRMQLEVARRLVADDRLAAILADVDRDINVALSASRSLAVELSPPVLHDVGLAAGLNWLAGQMKSRHGLSVQVRAEESAEPDEHVRLFLFYAVRELLFNVAKHAKTDSAEVRMARDDDWCCVEVLDEGKGFEVDSLDAKPAPDGRFGLFSIRERLSYLGGMVDIRSAPDVGTRILLKAPINLETDVSKIPAVHKPPVQGAVKGRRPGDGKLRVLLADDHKIVRQGLLSMLMYEPDLEIVGEAADGKQACELSRQLRPDVVVMDVSMPVMDGIEATKLIRDQFPDTQIIGLSMHESSDVAAAMLKAGAAAYLTKGGPSEELVSAIRTCAARNPCLTGLG
ncbi:MAG: response regulator [Acidobacteria bacterium]|nr:MAG: response regulator [Acidobacteriota bacterium]